MFIDVVGHWGAIWGEREERWRERRLDGEGDDDVAEFTGERHECRHGGGARSRYVLTTPLERADPGNKLECLHQKNSK